MAEATTENKCYRCKNGIGTDVFICNDCYHCNKCGLQNTGFSTCPVCGPFDEFDSPLTPESFDEPEEPILGPCYFCEKEVKYHVRWWEDEDRYYPILHTTPQDEEACKTLKSIIQGART